MSELQIIVTIIITALTTLGVPKLIDAWQKSRIKVTEAETTHRLAQESLAVQHIIDNSEKLQRQIDELQNTKFSQMRDDFGDVKAQIIGLREELNLLEKKLVPCETLFSELQVNREKTLEQSTKTHHVLKDMLKMFNVVGNKMGIDMKRFDSTGLLSDVMDAAFSGEDSSASMRIRGRTGQFASAPRPQDNQE